MKRLKLKRLLTIALVSVFFNSEINAFFCACDTDPNPGQTVGRCLVESGPTGCFAICGTGISTGHICFFGESSEN